MKILMMTNTYLPIVGGLEKSIQSFTKKLREWGHEVRIAVPQLKGTEIADKGIVRIPAVHQLKQTGFAIALPIFTSLAKAIDEFQPDLIHAHHPFLMGEMALRLSARYVKPLVFTYHIMFDQYAHYLPIPATLSRRFLVELAAGFANLSTRVIAPSESVREILWTQGVKSPVDVIPTGVDLGVFKNHSEESKITLKGIYGVPENAFVLGYVSRLAPEKNLGFLSRAVIGFMKKNSKAHFLVAGKGPSQEMMESLFAEAGMEDRFHYAGVLKDQALVNCYHAMDVFVFASKSETQGMVLYEAMAAGVPVIALNAPGAREVVKDHVNGLLLSKENESDFAAALTWFQKLNFEEKQRIKLMARNTAKIFSTDVCTLKLIDTYQAALASPLMPKSTEQGEWRRMMRRLKTEWKIISNISHATKAAIREMTNLEV